MEKILDLEMISFDPRHLECAYLTKHEDEAMKRVDDPLKTVSELSRRSAQAVTLLHDGRIILMCGFMVLWPGVAEMWMFPTIYLEQHKFNACKAAKSFIETIGETMRLHRMQALALDDEQHNNFMEFLGFDKEGTLKQYTDIKEDFNQWGRIWPLYPQS